jgi:hypothetical protein
MDVESNNFPSILDLNSKISIKETSTINSITNVDFSSIKR